MQTVSSEFTQAFAEDDIYADAKVIIEFGNNRYNDGQVITASSTKPVNNGLADSIQDTSFEFWRADDVFNNKNRNTMKWLVCDSGATVQAEENGQGYRAIYLSEDDYERGWWSANKSDGSGNFATPPWVQSEFFEEDGITPFERRVNKITLYTTEFYVNMKEVTIQYKDITNTWVNVVANATLPQNTYINSWDYPSDIIIRGLRVYIHSTWGAGEFARINELQGLYIKDVSEDIVTVDVRETRTEYESTVPIGIHAANTVDVELDNTTGQYNIENEASTFYPYISPGNRVEVQFGVRVDENTYEYVPYGEFWVDEWANDSGDMTARLSARDFSKFVQDESISLPMVWKNTNVSAVFYNILARLGFAYERVNIDETSLRGFEILFVKDQTIWGFMNEIALADQGVFGFDRSGDFYYHSYNRLNTAPYDTSQYSFNYNREIENAQIQTQLYVNKVIVRVSPYSIDETGIRPIWGVSENTVLGWAKLQSSINSSATTIPVTAATNQSSGNLTTNTWNKSGYLWLPTINSVGKVTAGELIKYKSRTDSAFTECERGYLNTPAVSHSAGKYIGEVNVFDMEFDNAPAQKVAYFLTAIDTLLKLDNEGTPQAHVLVWDTTAFGGKLVIGNRVNYYTLLSGEGASFKDKFDGNTNSDDDVLFTWATSVAGIVATEKTGQELVGKDNEYTELNKDYIRRYGKNELEIDNQWIQSKAHAEDIADIIIDEFRNPREILQFDGIIYLPVELADRVTILNLPQLSIQNKQYHVIEISTTYDGGFTGSYTLREVKV
jgi:hypothetical protein